MPRRRLVNQNRTNLDRLTARWRARHDLRREGDPYRPRANPGREALARRGFPYRDVTPADYVAEHGADMAGFTYDDESYADADLDAWLVEVGELLRARREAGSETTPPGPSSGTSSAKAAAKPPAKPPTKPRAKSSAKAKPKPAADG